MLRLDWVGPLVLCTREIRRVPYRVEGIYLLHAFAAPLGGYPVFYVGRSRDLQRRLREHLADTSAKPAVRMFRDFAPAYFSAAAVLHPMLLDHIEAGLIRALRPPCNDQVPTSVPLLVTLPPLRAFVP